jgi:hypothetical protein
MVNPENSRQAGHLVRGARLLVMNDGPHCIPWTHAQEKNVELLSFLAEKASTSAKEVA